MNEKRTVQVAAGLIRDGSRFLICRRPETKARALLWEFPGGKLEPGETAAQALVRECREELDVETAEGTEVTRVTYEYPDLTVCLILLETQILCGTPKLLEHKEMRWITAEETDSFEFCPADVAFLEPVRKRLAEEKQ